MLYLKSYVKVIKKTQENEDFLANAHGTWGAYHDYREHPSNYISSSADRLRAKKLYSYKSSQD